MGIGNRLREERVRLGMSQTEFAEVAGLIRKTLYGYECGERFPDAAALAKWADAGVDVMYVLTGNREATKQEERIAARSPVAPALSDSDRALLRDFHAAPAQVQAGVKTTLGAFTPTSDSRRKWKRTA
ncbi:helix-turn-helix transcriptional regulator [Achromobacter xylosoxidans]